MSTKLGWLEGSLDPTVGSWTCVWKRTILQYMDHGLQIYIQYHLVKYNKNKHKCQLLTKKKRKPKYVLELVAYTATDLEQLKFDFWAVIVWFFLSELN